MIIKKLQSNDHKIVGSIIGDSFADDPVNLWIFGKKVGMTSYFGLAAKKLYLEQGYGHRVNDDGCTLWLPPSVKKAIPLWNSLDIAASMIWNNGPKSILRGMKVDGALDARHPKEPHHYLFAIGTRPSKQGKGVGGKLMAAGLEQVDRDQLPAYLESSKEINVPFYQNFGFEVIEKITPTPGCPPLWLMWREPRDAGSSQST